MLCRYANRVANLVNQKLEKVGRSTGSGESRPGLACASIHANKSPGRQACHIAVESGIICAEDIWGNAKGKHELFARVCDRSEVGVAASGSGDADKLAS